MTRSPAFIFIALLAAGAPAAAQDGEPESTVLDGVFTTRQVTRGRSGFLDQCAGCHTSGQFSDPAFVRKWDGRALHDMFEFIRTSMPNDMPGSLSDATYVDVVTYILSINRFPTGESELPPDPAVLKRIRMVGKPDG